MERDLGSTFRVMFQAKLLSGAPAEGKSITVTFSKNCAAFGGSLTATYHSVGGWYWFTVPTTHTDTLGPLAWQGVEVSIQFVSGIVDIVPPSVTMTPQQETLLKAYVDTDPKAQATALLAASKSAEMAAVGVQTKMTAVFK